MEATNKITFSNYEAFMVDYWDGSLSPLYQEMLMRFLDEHPDLKKEAEDAGMYTLPQEDLFFTDKQNLFKIEVSTENIDEFLVAELEHDLLPHEENELQLFIASNPQHQRDRALYALTKLNPDKNFIYPYKRKLKKGVLQPVWIQYVSVAAAACLFLVFGIWWSNRDTVNDMAQGAKTNSIITKKSPPVITLTPIEPLKESALKTTTEIPVKSVQNNKTIPAIVVEKQVRNIVQPMPVKDAVCENFYSYSENRKPDDFLSGLVNSYLPQETNIIAYTPETPEKTEPEAPITKKTTAGMINEFASKGLLRIIKDSALAQEIGNQKYSIKTKLAKTFAWATGKATGGKLKATAIPNVDGTLAAMSFTNGKYNYTKKF